MSTARFSRTVVADHDGKAEVEVDVVDVPSDLPNFVLVECVGDNIVGHPVGLSAASARRLAHHLLAAARDLELKTGARP